MGGLDEYEPVEETAKFEFPERKPWSSAAVKLLKGVVYHDDQGDTWNDILANVSPLIEYFGRLGVVLTVDEGNGMAWLHQPETDELPADYESIPKLFHKSPLGFEGTLLCVVLRGELRRSEEEDLESERCVVRQSDLLESWRLYFSEHADDHRLKKDLIAQLRKLEKLKFIRAFEKSPPTWEIRKVLKARLPLETLKTIRDELKAELIRRSGGAK